MTRISPSQPIFIFGKTNMLGQAFAHVCEERRLNYLLFGPNDLNVTDKAAIDEALEALNPIAVINTIGASSVEDAELSETTCHTLHTEVPGLLAKLCKQHKVSFVHFSSDQVFNGAKGAPYIESDIPSPINIYGQSKYEGELLVQDENPSALIIRTGTCFSPWSEYDFAHDVLQSLQKGLPFTAANDIIMSPTYVPDLVYHTLNYLQDDVSGILHLASSGKATWAELAMQIAIKAGYPASLVEPVSAYNLHSPAVRSPYSVLSSEYGAKMPYYQEALQRYFAAVNFKEDLLTSFAA